MPILKNIKHEAFCQEYVKNKQNATQAYINAGYNVNHPVAQANGSRLLSNDKIKDRFNELRNEMERGFWNDNAIFITSERIDRLKEIYDNEDVTDIIHGLIDKMICEKVAIDDVIVRKPISKMTRYELLINAGGKCQLCGQKPKPDSDIELHVDHIIPVSMGGVNHVSNYQVLCGECNLSKGNRYSIDHGC